MQLPLYFRPFIGGFITPFITIGEKGPPCRSFLGVDFLTDLSLLPHPTGFPTLMELSIFWFCKKSAGPWNLILFFDDLKSAALCGTFSFRSKAPDFFSEQSLESKLVMVQVGESKMRRTELVAGQCRGIVASTLPETNTNTFILVRT